MGLFPSHRPQGISINETTVYIPHEHEDEEKGGTSALWFSGKTSGRVSELVPSNYRMPGMESLCLGQETQDTIRVVKKQRKLV